MTHEEGRGALVGEFMESFFSSSPDMQDQIIFHAVKSVFAKDRHALIDPFPVLAHLFELMEKSRKTSPL